MQGAEDCNIAYLFKLIARMLAPGLDPPIFDLRRVGRNTEQDHLLRQNSGRGVGRFHRACESLIVGKMMI